jgi:hypothetical protein
MIRFGKRDCRGRCAMTMIYRSRPRMAHLTLTRSAREETVRGPRLRFGLVSVPVASGIALLLAALLLARWGPSHQLSASEPSPVIGRANHPAVIAINSCAATACHGGPNSTRRGEWNTAYSIWHTRDPHATAYATLFSERSRRIVELLDCSVETKASTDSAPENRSDVKPTYEARLGLHGCVACHSTVQEENRSAGLFRADGVNCQSCHGSAKSWETAHLKQDWAGSFTTTKATAGLNNLQDLAVRAEVCCRCHVGSPATGTEPQRVVNHDLIAAGHPRLNFEFNAYFTSLTQQSAHWNVAAEQARHANYPAKRWAAGQVASARASLKLLEHHASQPIWPEFSQHDCYACHHSLRWPSFRQRNAEPPLGVAAWGTWYLPRSGFVYVELEKAGDNSTVSRLTKSMMQSLPDGDASQKLGIATTLEIDGTFASQQAGSALIQLRETVLREPRWNWDECTQWYLAAAVWQQLTSRAPGNDTREIETNMIQLRELLNVPPLDVPLAAQPGTPGDAVPADDSRPDKIQSLVRALIVQFNKQKVPPE